MDTASDQCQWRRPNAGAIALCMHTTNRCLTSRGLGSKCNDQVMPPQAKPPVELAVGDHQVLPMARRVPAASPAPFGAACRALVAQAEMSGKKRYESRQNTPMPVLPKTRFARLLAAAWISLCIAVLVFGVIQRSIHDMPIAFTWFMSVLSAPLGLIIIPVIGMATSNASSALGVPYEPVLDLVPLWLQPSYSVTCSGSLQCHGLFARCSVVRQASSPSFQRAAFGSL